MRESGEKRCSTTRWVAGDLDVDCNRLVTSLLTSLSVFSPVSIDSHSHGRFVAGRNARAVGGRILRPASNETLRRAPRTGATTPLYLYYHGEGKLGSLSPEVRFLLWVVVFGVDAVIWLPIPRNFPRNPPREVFL